MSAAARIIFFVDSFIVTSPQHHEFFRNGRFQQGVFTGFSSASRFAVHSLRTSTFHSAKPCGQAILSTPYALQNLRWDGKNLRFHTNPQTHRISMIFPVFPQDSKEVFHKVMHRLWKNSLFIRYFGIFPNKS